MKLIYIILLFLKQIIILLSIGMAVFFPSLAYANGVLLPKKSFCPSESTPIKTVLSKDGKQLFVLEEETNNGVVWFTNGQKRAVLDAKYSAAFFPDGEQLATANQVEFIARDGNDSYPSSGFCLVIWDIASQSILRATRPSKTPDDVLDNVVISPDGEKIAAHSMTAWHMANGKSGNLAILDKYLNVVQIVAIEDSPETILFSPDGHKLLVITENPEMGRSTYLYSVDDGQLLYAFESREDGDFMQAAFSPDGKSVLLSSSRIVYWYDINGYLLHQFSLVGEEYIDAVAFAPDGKTIAAVRDNQLYLWDTDSKKPNKQNLAQHNRGRGLTFTPDSQGLFIGCEWYEVGENSLFLQASHAPIKKKMAGKSKIHTDVSTLFYYEGFPFLTVEYEYQNNKNCTAPATHSGENTRWVRVPFQQAQSKTNGVSDIYRAQLDGNNRFKNKYLQGKLYQDGLIEGVLTINNHVYPFHKYPVKKMKQQFYCEYRKEESTGENEEPLKKEMYFEAQTLPETYFGKQQFNHEKQYTEQKFAEAEMVGIYAMSPSGVFSHLQQQLMYAEGELLSVCAKRDISMGGASNYVKEECRSYYQGRKVEPQHLFYDLNESPFYTSDLRTFLLKKITAKNNAQNSESLKELSDNFYADHDGIVFVFNAWTLPGQDKHSVKIKFTYDELSQFIDLSAIGK